MGAINVTGKLTETKLVHMSSKQKEELEEIKNEVSQREGSVSTSQIIRDAVEILVCVYRKDIVERYTPKSIRELVKNDGEEKI